MLTESERAALKARVARNRATVRPGRVVKLSASDTGPVLFLTHPIGGTVLSYLHLVKLLGEAFTVYGVAADGLAAGTRPAASMAGMVERYLADLRQVQPAGPYRLGGWSMGGVLTFEMAHVMEEAGEELEFIALFDPPFRFPDLPAGLDAELAGAFLADATRGMNVPVEELPDPQHSPVDEQLDWLAGRLHGGAGLRDELQRRYELFFANTQVLGGYRPRYSVRADTLLIGASESVNLTAHREWPEVLAGRVSSTVLEADHYSLMVPPAIDQVAALLLGFAASGPDR